MYVFLHGSTIHNVGSSTYVDWPVCYYIDTCVYAVCTNHASERKYLFPDRSIQNYLDYTYHGSNKVTGSNIDLFDFNGLHIYAVRFPIIKNHRARVRLYILHIDKCQGSICRYENVNQILIVGLSGGAAATASAHRTSSSAVSSQLPCLYGKKSSHQIKYTIVVTYSCFNPMAKCMYRVLG